MMRCCSIRRAGFTLVELLVVVAVVALLVGLLVPALGAAQRSAWKIKSASNQRQLVLANEVHANEQQERYVAASPRIATENLIRWHGTRDSTGVPFEAEGGPLAPYLEGETGSAAVRVCPRFEPTAEDLVARGKGFERGCGGYGYNDEFVGKVRDATPGGTWRLRTDERGARRTRFVAPSRTVMFADAALAESELIEYSFVTPPFWPQYGVAAGLRPDPSIHFRHDGVANIARLDGHVSAERMSFTQPSAFYPTDPGDYGIGWFGDVSSLDLFAYRAR